MTKAAKTKRSGNDAKTACTGRSVSVLVERMLMAGVILLITGGCVTVPRYRSAGPECMEYAIASCRTAIVEDGLEAGLIHYIPTWGGGTAHAVIWVKDKDGVERVYDPAYKCYRIISKNAVILHKGRGLDLGIYGMLLQGSPIGGKQFAAVAR